MEKWKGVWQCQEFYVAGGHALRPKAHRQIHISRLNCRGTNVMPVPNTQKDTKFCPTGSLRVLYCCMAFSGNYVMFWYAFWFFNCCGLCSHGLPCNHRDTFCVLQKKAVPSASSRRKLRVWPLKKWSNVTSVAGKSQTVNQFLLWWFGFLCIRALLHLCSACSLRPCVYKPCPSPVIYQLFSDPKEDS